MNIRIKDKTYYKSQIKIDNELSYYDSGMTKILVNYEKHNLLDGDYISLSTNINNKKYFSERVPITKIDKDNFYFDAFEDISISAKTLTNNIINYYIYENEQYGSSYKKANAVIIELDTNAQHMFISNKGGVDVSETISNFYYELSSDYEKRRCVGDYVVYNNFLYKAEEIDSYLYKYKLDGAIQNLCDRYIYYYDDNNKPIKLGGGYINGISKKFNTITINNVKGHGIIVVPVDANGNEITNYLFWLFDVEDNESLKIFKELMTKIEKSKIQFYTKDERFYRENFKWEASKLKTYNYSGKTLPDACWQYEDIRYKVGNVVYICNRSGSVTLNKDEDYISTLLYKTDGDFNISFPIINDFSTDTFTELKFSEYYIDDIIDANRNDVIDYEKVQFLPMFIDSDEEFSLDTIDDNNFKKVNEIEFNFHFLERNYQIVNERYGNAEVGFTDFTYRDYGDWPNSKNDSNYWNFVDVTHTKDSKNDTMSYDNKNITEFKSDLLGDLGFYDDDIFYQKDRLKNSFIRLSFYDSRNRGSQTLLFYANVYFDVHDLYDKYVKILSTIKLSGKDDDDKYVYEQFNGNDDLRLSSRITIKSKYESTTSSEGFYMYTYPSFVEGNKLTPVYMKVDFNHAKYGTTTNLVMPTDSDGIPCNLTKGSSNLTLNSDFPLNYMKNTNPIYLGSQNTDYDYIYDNNDVDMARVLSDQYIKLYVKYDFVHKCYIWFLPRTTGEDPTHIVSSDGKIIFNLFEPKIKNTGDDFIKWKQN